ncbi:hypothetical protein [Spirosoma pulveris]
MPFGVQEQILHPDDYYVYALFNDYRHTLPRSVFVALYRYTVHYKAVGIGSKLSIRLKL